MSGVDNPSAFPCVGYGVMGDSYMQEGMTLRDYFAAHALGACIAACSAGQHTPKGTGTVFDMLSQDAYSFADAMLSERDKRNA